MNDLPPSLGNICYPILYADDTTFLVKDQDRESLRVKAQLSLTAGETWFNNNKLLLNAAKTSTATFTSCRRSRELHGSSVKYLGVYLDSLLTWKPQVDFLCSKLSRNTYALRRIYQTVGLEVARTAYFALFHSVMSYAAEVWARSAHAHKVFVLQKRAVRILTNRSHRESCRGAFKQTGILTLAAVYIWRVTQDIHQRSINIERHSDVHTHGTRNCDLMDPPFRRLNTSSNQRLEIQLYNHVAGAHRGLNIALFRKRMKSHLMDLEPYDILEFLCT